MVKIYFNNFPIMIGLSFNRKCQAGCIWCPIGQRLQKDNAEISFETVDNIIDSITKMESKNQPREFWFGENGESLLHPRFREIVSRFRTAFPDKFFAVNSNLNLMDKGMGQFLMENKFNWIGFNFDGMTAKGYEAVKKLPFETAYRNLMALIELRSQLKSATTFHCSILTQPHYYTSIREPEKITVEDEEINAFQFLREVLEWGENDTILIPFVLQWAVREKRMVPRNPDMMTCIGMHSFGVKMFIDPDGDVYPCCSDYDSDYVFGNVNEKTILEIWYGDRRRRFLDLWLRRRWTEIGKPCMYCAD